MINIHSLIYHRLFNKAIETIPGTLYESQHKFPSAILFRELNNAIDRNWFNIISFDISKIEL